MLEEKEGLWYKVLVAKYGIDDDFILEGGVKVYVWWKDLASVREGKALVVGRWVNSNISRLVGNGEHTLFWKDNWLEERPLK
ncbi:alpha-1 6-xylosyltransferase, partial [Trifolium medium]|nr:alpha-1 6-xylosyltransferase [Trifolium medium]